jgi:hypothetical protein
MAFLPKATHRLMLLVPFAKRVLQFQSHRHGHPRQCKMRILRISFMDTLGCSSHDDTVILALMLWVSRLGEKSVIFASFCGVGLRIPKAF